MNATNSVKAALYIARAGATVSSFGLAGLLWATHRWAMRTIYFDPSFFWAAAALGLAAWAVLRYRLPMPERHVWQVWHVFTRATLAVAAVLLAVSGSRAGLVDPREIAYGAAMRVDLRHLMDAEDEFFAAGRPPCVTRAGSKAVRCSLAVRHWHRPRGNANQPARGPGTRSRSACRYVRLPFLVRALGSRGSPRWWQGATADDLSRVPSNTPMHLSGAIGLKASIVSVCSWFLATFNILGDP